MIPRRPEPSQPRDSEDLLRAKVDGVSLVPHDLRHLLEKSNES